MRTDSPLRKHRFWPRFTLRVLLVFVTLVGVGLGYWTHRARQQRRIVERIEQGGGMVCYEREGPVAPEPRNFAVEWLAKFLSRDYLERVDYANVRSRDAIRDLHHLRGLAGLKISFEGLRDDDLTFLSRCDGLQTLQLGDPFYLGSQFPKSTISDKSLYTIARLPRLEVAQLYGPGFSREGLVSLGSLGKLRQLQIGLCDNSVFPGDFNRAKQIGQIQTLRAWRATPNSGVEEFVKW